MIPGKLIAFEGIDQSGKETQAKRLTKRLSQEGWQVLYLSFPEYETPIGQMLSAFLRGATSLTPHVRHLLYTANRFEFFAPITSALNLGQIVICDRYSESGVAYGMANKLDRQWLYDIERDLPRADLLFYLAIEPELARQRKPQARDIYEANVAFLRQCNTAYQQLCQTDPRWQPIDGSQGIDEIERIVYEKVKALLTQDRRV